MEAYLRERKRRGGPDEHLFVLSTGRPMHPVYLATVFVKLARRVGLRAGPGEPGPRLHDLRHGFAVRALENMLPAERRDVGRHMLALSTYLGHSSIADTYWYPSDRRPDSTTIMRKLGGHWPGRELAVTMNRMHCRPEDGGTWRTVRVRERQEWLGIAEFNPATADPETINAQEATHRLGIYITSVHRLIREGTLPATQLMPSAP